MYEPFANLLIEATCRVMVGPLTRAAGWLLEDQNLVITSGSTIRRGGRFDEDVKVLFSDGIARAARIIDLNVVAAKGVDYAVLRILDPIVGRTGLRPLEQHEDAMRGELLIAKYAPLESLQSEVTSTKILFDFVERGPDTAFRLPHLDEETLFTPGGPIFSPVLGGVIGMLAASGLARPDSPRALVVPTHEILKRSKPLDFWRHQRPSPGRQIAVEETDVQRTSESAGTQRYPAANFYDVGADGAVRTIGPNERLPRRKSPARLEYRFKLDSQPGGIPYDGERPEIVLPASLPEGVTLGVAVWSEDFLFRDGKKWRRSAQKSIELPREGASSVADFVVRIKPSGQFNQPAALFTFVRHQAKLIAAFQLKAFQDPELPADQPRYFLEHCYLSPEWFRLHGRQLEAPVAAIYFRRDGDDVRAFGFSTDDAVWAGTNSDVEGLQQTTRQIYLCLHRLARQSARPDALRFGRASGELCHLGNRLFNRLFYGEDEPARRKVLKQYADMIRNLPVGAEVAVLADQSTESLILPWGIIYDGKLPQPYTGGQSSDGFWGVRFKLSVNRSVMQPVRREAREKMPLRVARVYHHLVPIVLRMAKSIGSLQRNGRLGPPIDLSFDTDAIVGLNERPFDFIHFFCHGYTQFLDAELARLLELADQDAKPDEEVMYRATDYSGSHIATAEGTATYEGMLRELDRLPEGPIVFLSMCQSAQVSTSGSSFANLFLKRGARALVATEGPNPWRLGRKFDTKVLVQLLRGVPLADAVWTVRRKLIRKNVLALLYVLYGDGRATLGAPARSNLS